MDGHFTPSSGRMTGSYRERTYHYKVEIIEKYNGEKRSRNLDANDLRDADRIFFSITGGHLKDERAYRWVAGPYESQADMEAAITDMMLYGSP